jgi:hypothetical protein
MDIIIIKYSFLFISVMPDLSHINQIFSKPIDFCLSVTQKKPMLKFPILIKKPLLLYLILFISALAWNQGGGGKRLAAGAGGRDGPNNVCTYE